MQSTLLILSNSFKAFCRIEVDIETYPGSNAKSEVWLPDDWNSRFLGVGNGASGGGIAWSDLGYYCVNEGFAGHSTVSTRVWRVLRPLTLSLTEHWAYLQQ